MPQGRTSRASAALTRARAQVRRAGAALPRRLHKSNRRARGAAELSVVVAAGSLVAGVFFGSGLSHTSVHLADGLTWLSDSPSGEIVQVNPSTGELQNRQLVGSPGDHLQVAQYDGQLYVTNQTTGQLMSFDLTSILVSGQRRVSTGGAVDTLSHDGKVFLVDTDSSTISDIDPVTTDAIGTIWVSSVGLADVAIDQQGTVWALEDDGTLRELRWSDDSMSFEEVDKHTIAMSGQNSVLVAHDRGVTVFGPDQGIVQQVGTGRDLTADAPKVEGTVLAPESSPSDLVPVATDGGEVVIATPDHVQDVDMASLGCPKPGTPEVFHGVVYVPCEGGDGSGSDGGGGKVIKLDANGNRVGDDIDTPQSSDPQLVLDDTSLIINTPGAAHGVVVHDDGSISGVTRQDPAIPVSTPGASAAPPASIGTVIKHLLHHGDDEDGPDPGDSPTTPPGNPDATVDPGDDTSSGPGDENTGDSGNSGEDSGDNNGDHTNNGTPGNGTDGTDGNNGDHNNNGDDGNNGPTSHSDPMNAPSNVTAVALPEAQVQISWSRDAIGPKPEGFLIRDTDGQQYASVKSDVTQAVISVEPGKSLSFTVTAVLGKQQATSKPTSPITTTARPDKPTVSGTADYQQNGSLMTFAVTVSWTPPSANGSPITEYDVQVNTPDGTKTTTTTSNLRSATFTWDCDNQDDPACKVGGNATATVTAVNALGDGDAGSTTITAPAQPDPPLPPNGETIVDPSSPKSTSAGQEGDGQIVLRLKPPTDWAKFTGTCSYTTSDVSGGGPVACSAKSLTVSFHNGYIRDPASGTVSHTVTFTATNGNGTATSKTYTYTSTQPTLCQECQIP